MCGTALAENLGLPTADRPPCPKCGSIGRAVSIHIGGTLYVHSKTNFKGRHPGESRPFVDLTVGDDLHLKSGIWMRLERLIDRAKNLYREHVVNPGSGEIVHHCEEPLFEHRGHGSAKLPSQPNESSDA